MSKSGRGGRRPGAGRPPSDRPTPTTVAVRCSPEQIEKLDAMCDGLGVSRSEVVRRMIDKREAAQDFLKRHQKVRELEVSVGVLERKLVRAQTFAGRAHTVSNADAYKVRVEIDKEALIDEPDELIPRMAQLFADRLWAAHDELRKECLPLPPEPTNG